MTGDYVNVAELFDMMRYDVDRAIERAAIDHAGSEDHFRAGLDRCAPEAVAAGWDLEKTLSELGKLYDIGYGEPEIEPAPLPEDIAKELEEMGLPARAKSAGVELQRRIMREMTLQSVGATAEEFAAAMKQFADDLAEYQSQR